MPPIPVINPNAPAAVAATIDRAPAWCEVPFLPPGEHRQPAARRGAITGLPEGAAVLRAVGPA